MEIGFFSLKFPPLISMMMNMSCLDVQISTDSVRLRFAENDCQTVFFGGAEGVLTS